MAERQHSGRAAGARCDAIAPARAACPRGDDDVGRPCSVEGVDRSSGFDEVRNALICSRVTGGSPLTRTCSNRGAASLTGLAVSMPIFGWPAPVVFTGPPDGDMTAEVLRQCSQGGQVRGISDLHLGERGRGCPAAGWPCDQGGDLLGPGHPQAAAVGADVEERVVHPRFTALLEGLGFLGQRPHPLLKQGAFVWAEGPDLLEGFVVDEAGMLLRGGRGRAFTVAQLGELVRLRKDVEFEQAVLRVRLRRPTWQGRAAGRATRRARGRRRVAWTRPRRRRSRPASRGPRRRPGSAGRWRRGCQRRGRARAR